MTAPTPERRVGEAVVDYTLVRLYAEFTDAECAIHGDAGVVIRDLARWMLDERAANVRLTAEVERLREAGERFLYAIEGEGIVEAPTSEARSRFRNAISPRIPVSVEGATNG